MLQVRELEVEVGGRTTLQRASFSLRAGDKAGLVGRNGAGKTSLLRVIAGELSPVRGVVLRPDHVGFLPQDPKSRGTGVDATGISHVLSGRGLDQAAARLARLQEAVEERSDERTIARFSRAEEEFRHAGGYSADSEVRRLAAGLGLPDARLDLPLTALSGGERRRVELARILFAGNDLLLLDEPTNHLDVDAKRWLMGFLATYRGALLVVSHDLELLDEAITRVLHLDDGQLVEYRGNYSQYRVAHKADQERQRALASRQQTEIRRLATLADSMRGQTESRARKAKTLDHRVARLRAGAVTGPRGERRVEVRLPDPPRPGQVVLEVESLTKGYGAGPVFQGVDLTVGRGDRLLVMGLNGAGKTSLMRVLAGAADADAGSVRIGHRASVGYYAQEHENIVAGTTVLDHMRGAAPGSDQKLRGVLGMLGLSGDIAAQDAATLSGGEKTKLSLAMLVAGRHNVLLLDEPTNNLDPSSRAAIGAALRDWPGTVVFVSHDPEFVVALEPDRVLLMPDGNLDYWSDDLLELVALA